MADTDAISLKINGFYEEKRYDECLKESVLAVSQFPNWIDGYVMSGKSLTELGKFDEAYTMFRKGLDIDVNNPVLVAGLKQLQKNIINHFNEEDKKNDSSYHAVTLCSQEAYPGDDDLVDFEKEIMEKWKLNGPPQIAPRVPNPDKSLNEFKRGKQQTVAGNLDNALKHYVSAVEHDVMNFSYVLEVAELLRQKKEYRESFRYCNIAPPEFRQSSLWLLGGTVLAALGLPVTAETWLRRATQLERDDESHTAAIEFQKVRVKRLYQPLSEKTPIEISFTEYGRAVIAKEKIREGSVAFMDFPSVLSQTLDTMDYTACSNCARALMKPEEYFEKTDIDADKNLRDAIKKYWPKFDVKGCKGCKHETYCSESCKQLAWDNHHCIICPSVNKHTEKLYDVCGEWKTVTKDSGKIWTGMWNASYSPLVLVKMWASIICVAKKIAIKNGRQTPNRKDWSLAKAPLRKFIAYGTSSCAKNIPKMFNLVRDIFNSVEGINFDISEREFDGRYFQAACNVQAFSDSQIPLKRFAKGVRSDPKYKNKLEHYINREAPEAVFGGMFPLHACLNHSCLNNVEVMDGDVEGKPGVWVRARKDLEPGEELFTTYINTAKPRQHRRAWLFRAYNFWCKCPRCLYEGNGPEECTNCDKKAGDGAQFKTCSKCRKAWYCSTSCQKEAWKKGHKSICNKPHSVTDTPAERYI